MTYSVFTGTFMVVWKKEATLISAGNTKVIRDNRLTIAGTSLDISKVSSKDSGNYTCEINTDVPSHVNIVLNVLGEIIITFTLEVPRSSCNCFIRNDHYLKK